MRCHQQRVANLTRALGDDLRVVGWLNFGQFRPDFVTIVRETDACKKQFHLEHEMLDDTAGFDFLVGFIRETFHKSPSSRSPL